MIWSKYVLSSLPLTSIFELTKKLSTFQFFLQLYECPSDRIVNINDRHAR